jgi:hypothetical protein
MRRPVLARLLCSVHRRTCVAFAMGGNHTPCASQSVGTRRRPDYQCVVD